jgi:hypothetical protein
MLLGFGSARSLNLPLLISWEYSLSLLPEQLSNLQEDLMTALV